MNIRQIQDFLEDYQQCYFNDCLRVMQSNIPQFFAEYEKKDFEAFLNVLIERKGEDINGKEESYNDEYYVLRRHNGDIIGCGGISICLEEKIGYLRWSMIDAKYHLQKWGSLLTLSRIRSLMERFPLKELRLYTSNEVVGFYKKLGFDVVDFKKDYYREGLDRYDMILVIDEASKKRLIDHEAMIRARLLIESEMRTVISR